MNKCPKCKKEINKLVNYQSGENKYILDDDGDCFFKEFQEDGKINEYECPECNKVLFNDDRKARSFLEGE